MLWIILVLVISIGALIYKWATKHYNYFKDRNIAHGKPSLFFGTGKDLFLLRLSFADYIQKWYKEFPNEK